MIVPVLSAAIALGLSIFYSKLRHQRSRYNGIPQFPSSLLLGHLKTMDDAIKRGNPERHPDQVFREMYDELGRPQLMILDLWPLRRPIVVVGDHEIAELLTKASPGLPYGLPKGHMASHLTPLIGKDNLLVLEGEEWKQARKSFNPGFAHQNLVAFIPQILDKTDLFLQRLDQLSAKDEPFSMLKLATDLTLDIIGEVVIGTNLHAQPLDGSPQGEVPRLFLELVDSFTNTHAEVAWWMTPRKTMKRRRLGMAVTELLKDIILKTQQEPAKVRRVPQTILSRQLQSVDELTPEIVEDLSEQMKVMVFAGHDTTSVLVSYALFELSRTPRTLKALRAELDELLGPDPSPEAIRERLLGPSGEDVMSRMVYTSAVIKETLRLYPPASAARVPEPGSGFRVPTASGEQSLDGTTIYSCATILQRDPKVYGDTADDFVPERWLSGSKPGGQDIPSSAWRPFERGPRICIGQDLANIEVRILLALVARRYDFVKVGLGAAKVDRDGRPILNGKGQFESETEMYSILQITAKPGDGMMMKARRRHSNK